ncbi:MAG: DM13 domain-containing protein [Candidatus Limnocylindrales bacterium]
MEILGDLERFFATSLYPLRVPIAIGLGIGFVVLVLIARRRGWPAAARRHPARTALAAVVVLAIGLPTAWYLGSPLFIRTSLVEPAPGPTTAAATSTPSTPGGTAVPGGSVGLSRTGQFTGADEFHFGSGTARLVETEPGTWIVRFEEFSVQNGPDLYVYLSPDAGGYTQDALELGTLKATDGSFNYEVPSGTDVSGLRSVVIWCKQFAVQFAVAPLE